MAVIAAYITVILIWSTTPLAIKLSNDSLAPIAAVSLRMLLAFVGGWLVTLLWRKAGRLQLANVKSYALASLTLFPSMPMVYYAAQFISSGLISVLFGLMPLVSAVFAAYILDEHFLTWRRVVAQLIALAGLVLISYGQLNLSEQAIYGVLLTVLATTIYAWSSVYLKKFNKTQEVAAFEQTVGALLFSLPGMFICWWLIEDDFQLVFSATSAISVSYLAFVGSLVGFFAFFWVLNKLSMSLISIIPVITPMLALWLGMTVAGEELAAITLLGAGLIISGLMLYEGIPMWLWKKARCYWLNR
ncbi:DMT family transporter [Dasania sp. GY-MA-18]|uniref:DMT family transporter n=1 Tax=Dasania phycosphaerae TaxID=2950436 RepID=A0A9J6RNT1_9GAMM|nr:MULTISPECIES: DMT family transporter [Dasania]MCR8923229.1 DMT family transporter [Dasania sp. GY-MA-18]MCZ0865661.1 DMT family transporter [Dasania phycosphaerae]MCZ0869386.1 DMT family transporter [Dasania phycosphaerae]